MATVKRHTKNSWVGYTRRVFRPTEPGLTKDLNMYIERKIHKYIDYLDSIDNGLYCLEYDNDIPTIDELLNGIDQHLLSSGYAKSDARFNRENRLRKEEEAKLKVEQELLKSQESFWDTHRHLVAQLEAKRKQEALEREERKRLKEIAEIKKEARLKEILEETRIREEKRIREENHLAKIIIKRKINFIEDELARVKEGFTEGEREWYYKMDRELLAKVYCEEGRDSIITYLRDAEKNYTELIGELKNMPKGTHISGYLAKKELLMAYDYRKQYIKTLLLTVSSV
jgi:hypothetical protein